MPEITSVDLERLSTRVKAFAEVLRGEHLALENKFHANYWNKERNRFSDSKAHMERVLEQLTPYPEAGYDSMWQERYELLRDYLDHVEQPETERHPNDRQTFDEFAHYHRERREQLPIKFDDDPDIESRLRATMSYSQSQYDSTKRRSPSL